MKIVSTALAFALVVGLIGVGQAAQRAVPIKTIRAAANKLKAVARRAEERPNTQYQWGGVSAEAIDKVIQRSRLTTAGKRALKTAYTAAFPSGTEFRIDPKRADITRVLDSAVARLIKVAGKDAKVSKAEATKSKFWTPKNLYSYAAELYNK
jgi:hypothetical protein